jgi:hypothetical protein
MYVARVRLFYMRIYQNVIQRKKMHRVISCFVDVCGGRKVSFQQIEKKLLTSAIHYFISP